jgi:DNA-binding CsgD family transcriptional regulator
MMSKTLRGKKRLRSRQFGVMRRIALGQKSLEIAKALEISPRTVRAIISKPEAKEYLSLYLELLHLISDLTQADRTLKALRAPQDLLAQQVGIKELIDFAQDLMDLTGKKEFTETISRLKQTAEKLIDSQVA